MSARERRHPPTIARAAAVLSAATALLVSGCAGLQGRIQRELHGVGDELDAAKARAKEANRQLEERGRQIRSASSQAIDRITADDERALGQAAAINVIQQYGGLVLEEGLQRYLNEVANLVAAQGERQEKGTDGVARLNARRFFVGVLNDDSYNAFALPGGYVLVTKGLLRNLADEAELAWVLGHEIAHVDREDGLKALKVQVGTTAVMDEFIRGGTADAGAVGFGNSKFFAKLVDTMTRVTLEMGMGRTDEREADSLGLRYAIAAGYDARAARGVLALLGANPGKRALFSGHDAPATRAGILAAAIDAAPPGARGTGRFDVECAQRLEAWTAAAGAPVQ